MLCLGKSRDFHSQGAAGVVNVIPFTCLPGNIVQGVLKRFREDHGNLPVLNIVCDGQEAVNSLPRLEAFMHQVRQYRGIR